MGLIKNLVEKYNTKKEYYLLKSKENGITGCQIPLIYRLNSKFMLKSVYLSHGGTIDQLLKHQTSNKRMMLAIIAKFPSAYFNASNSLKKSKDFNLKVISYGHGHLINSMPSEFFDDKDIVLASINNDKFGWAYDTASNRLKEDEDIIRAKINHDGIHSIKNVYELLQRHPQIEEELMAMNSNN